MGSGSDHAPVTIRVFREYERTDRSPVRRGETTFALLNRGASYKPPSFQRVWLLGVSMGNGDTPLTPLPLPERRLYRAYLGAEGMQGIPAPWVAGEPMWRPQRRTPSGSKVWRRWRPRVADASRSSCACPRGCPRCGLSVERFHNRHRDYLRRRRGSNNGERVSGGLREADSRICIHGAMGTRAG